MIQRQGVAKPPHQLTPHLVVDLPHKCPSYQHLPSSTLLLYLYTHLQFNTVHRLRVADSTHSTIAQGYPMHVIAFMSQQGGAGKVATARTYALLERDTRAYRACTERADAPRKSA